MNQDFLCELAKLGYSVSTQVYQSGHTTVFQGHSQSSHSPVAIKLLTALSDRSYEKAYSECEVQLRFSYHSRVAQVLTSFGLRGPDQPLWSFVIVLEWLGRDFHKEVACRRTENRPWTEAELMRIARDLVETLAELQESGVAHRDIKPQNLFYTSQGYAKLGDFGSSRTEDFLACQRTTSQLTVTGTPFYMSPELKLALLGNLAKASYDPYKSDVYSLGMTLLCCYLLEPPTALMDMRTVEANTLTTLQAVHFPGLLKLLEGMLQRDPGQRPDFLQLRASLSEGLEPRCLHLPNEQRQGCSFECHGFFCCFCAPECTVTEGQNGVFRTYKCPVCSLEYDHFQPKETSELEQISVIHPPPITDTSEIPLIVENIRISAPLPLPEEAKPKENTGNRDNNEGNEPSQWVKCLFALCQPGRRLNKQLEGATEDF